MKRTLVIATLTMLLLAATSVTAAAAELQQAGHSSVYFMNIAIGENGVGTLKVNTEKHTFVFNAEGCDPSAQYYLYYMVDASRINPHLIGRMPINLGTAIATKDGSVHFAASYEDLMPGVPVTVDDLNTFVATKFAAGSFAQERLNGGYEIMPWIIGGYSPYDLHWVLNYNHPPISQTLVDDHVQSNFASVPCGYSTWFDWHKEGNINYWSLTLTVTDAAGNVIGPFNCLPQV